MKTTFSLDECLVAWTPPHDSEGYDLTRGEIKVGPLTWLEGGKAEDWASKYDLTWTLDKTLSWEGRTASAGAQMMDEAIYLFFDLVVGYKMDPEKVHKAMSSIEEYAQHCANIGVKTVQSS